MTTTHDILGPNGTIAHHYPGYESRPTQLHLAGSIAAALHGQYNLMAEAGTGTGKSFAYLAAIIEHLSTPGATRKPIIISTHTIALQEQIFYKDLPFLQSISPIPFTLTLMKGRSNYISRRLLESATNKQFELFATKHEIDELKHLTEWVKHSKDGSKSSLDHTPSPNVWDHVHSNTDNCKGGACRHYSSCYFYKARNTITTVHILLVNHALYFTDIQARRSGFTILPEHDIVIFDEASTVESVATEQLGWTYNRNKISRLMTRLYNESTGKGILTHRKLDNAWVTTIQDMATQAKNSEIELFTAVEKALGSKPWSSIEVDVNTIWPVNAVLILRHISNALKA